MGLHITEKLLVLLVCFCWISFGFRQQNVEFGYFLIDATPEVESFWWMHKPRNFNPTAPLIVYLEGFGCSGAVGDCLYLGPESCMNNSPQLGAWSDKANILFVDFEVGTGFSYFRRNHASKASSRRAQVQVSDVEMNEDQAVTVLEQFLENFFKTHPHMLRNDFWLMGRHSGARLAVLLGAEIDMNEDSSMSGEHFKGVILENPDIDPAEQAKSFGNYLVTSSELDYSQAEVVDNFGYEIAENLESLSGSRIEPRHYRPNNIFNNDEAIDQLQKAAELRKKQIRYVTEVTGSHLLGYSDSSDGDYLEKVVENHGENVMRRGFGVPRSVSFTACNAEVQEKMAPSQMISLVGEVSLLLNHSRRVVVVFGDRDWLVNALYQQRWMSKLTWPGERVFRAIARERVVSRRASEASLSEDAPPPPPPPMNSMGERGPSGDGVYIGHSKRYDLLSLYWVADAGFFALMDSPDMKRVVLEQEVFG